jgi:hypothetical protein
LAALWRGELPLRIAFWRWAVAGGLVVNLATMILLLVLVMQGQALAGFLVSHALALPYNILAGVGVWRSAARYPGSRHWADAARAAVAIWLAALTLT